MNPAGRTSGIVCTGRPATGSAVVEPGGTAVDGPPGDGADEVASGAGGFEMVGSSAHPATNTISSNPTRRAGIARRVVVSIPRAMR